MGNYKLGVFNESDFLKIKVSSLAHSILGYFHMRFVNIPKANPALQDTSAQSFVSFEMLYGILCQLNQGYEASRTSSIIWVRSSRNWGERPKWWSNLRFEASKSDLVSLAVGCFMHENAIENTSNDPVYIEPLQRIQMTENTLLSWNFERPMAHASSSISCVSTW